MTAPLLLSLLSVVCQEPAGVPVLTRGVAALTLDGELRLRFESRDGATPFAGSESESMSSGRFRFGLRAELDERFAAYAQFQKLVMDEGEDSDDYVHQAFLDWSEAAFGTDLQIGRFELDLGSGLLVGTDDWNGTGRAFDGVRATRAGETYTATLFWTQPVEEQAVAAGVDQSFGGVWLEYPITSAVTVDVDGLTRNDSTGSTSDLADQTVGGRLRGETLDGLRWSAELAAQVGEQGPLDAGGLIAAGEVAMPFASEGEAGLGFLWASGDDDPADGDQDAFVPLYDERHALLGAADLVAPSNVLDVYARGSWSLDGNWSVVGALHWMQLVEDLGAVPITGATGTGDSELGQELDLWLEGKLLTQLDLRIGGAQFLAGDAISGGDDQLWFFVQALVWF
jgi:hypothetical protein